jgi:hypothetical protein
MDAHYPAPARPKSIDFLFLSDFIEIAGASRAFPRCPAFSLAREVIAVGVWLEIIGFVVAIGAMVIVPLAACRLVAWLRQGRARP